MQGYGFRIIDEHLRKRRGQGKGPGRNSREHRHPYTLRQGRSFPGEAGSLKADVARVGDGKQMVIRQILDCVEAFRESIKLPPASLLPSHLLCYVELSRLNDDDEVIGITSVGANSMQSSPTPSPSTKHAWHGPLLRQRVPQAKKILLLVAHFFSQFDTLLLLYTLLANTELQAPSLTDCCSSQKPIMWLTDTQSTSHLLTNRSFPPCGRVCAAEHN